MKTIAETLAAVKQLNKEIAEKEAQMARLFEDIIKAHNIQSDNPYICEEDGKIYFPHFSFACNSLHDFAYEASGVNFPHRTWIQCTDIKVCCYPALSNGKRACRGCRFIDITKLKPTRSFHVC